MAREIFLRIAPAHDDPTKVDWLTMSWREPPIARVTGPERSVWPHLRTIKRVGFLRPPSVPRQSLSYCADTPETAFARRGSRRHCPPNGSYLRALISSATSDATRTQTKRRSTLDHARPGEFPMAMGHGGAASLASGRTTVKARHLGVGGGLVDEDDPRRIEVELSFEPRLARPAFTALRRCSAAWADFFCA